MELISFWVVVLVLSWCLMDSEGRLMSGSYLMRERVKPLINLSPN